MVPLLAVILVVLQGKHRQSTFGYSFGILCSAVMWTMINIIVMPDFALSLVNFAKDSVRTQTIFMACETVLFISAGSSILFMSCILMIKI